MVGYASVFFLEPEKNKLKLKVLQQPLQLTKHIESSTSTFNVRTPHRQVYG